MPNAPGWALREVGGGSGSGATTATGTTDLVFTKPSGCVQNDILIAAFAHKGTGYATPPAGWTLIQQEITASSNIRGEMYWKRAGGAEPGTYTFSGLAGSASGGMHCYAGGLLSGSVVAASSKRASAASSTQGATSITTTDPNCLIIQAFALGTNQSVSSSALSQPNSTIDPIDTQLTSQTSKTNVGTASGGGSRCAIQHWMKTIPGPTGDGLASVTITDEHVTLLAALIPETANATSGTRYYLSTKYPKTHLYGPKHGAWDSTIDSPRGFDIQDYIWELSQTKADAGYYTSVLQTDNQEDESILFYRWITPPLAAQTINGTFDVVQAVTASWTFVGTPGTSTVVYKVHIYITVGQSTAVRAVLLNKYIDNVSNALPATGDAWSLIAPQTLTAANAEEGDCVIVELGAYIVSSPQPAPTLPPSEYTALRLTRGACAPINGGFPGDRGIPLMDMARGALAGFRASYVDFSHTFVEQAYAGTPPANNSGAAAETISSVPAHIGPVDTSHATSTARAVWYKWTAPANQRMMAHLFGTYYYAQLGIFEGATFGAIANTSAVFVFGAAHTYTSRTLQSFNAVAGTTYWFRISTITQRNFGAVAAGGALRFALLPYQAPGNDAVFVATGGYVLCYDSNGTLINCDPGFQGSAISGLAIDYTKRPLVQISDHVTIHSADRLYVGVFTGSGLVEILDIATLNAGENEIDYIADSLGVASKHTATLAITEDGTLIVGDFGDGFRRTAGQQNSYQDRVSTAAAAALNVIDASHGDHQPGAPWPAATLRETTLEAGGTNYAEMALDGSFLYYDSADWYFPSAGGHTVRRYDPSAGVQLGDFVTLPGTTGPTPSLKGLFPVPDGGLLVCNGDHVVRLNAAGAIIQTYYPTDPDRSQSLADVELTVEADAFWVLDETSTSLFKFDLESGVQLVDVWTLNGIGSCTSIVVYRKDNPFLAGLGPPSNFGCPTTFPSSLGTSRAGCSPAFPVESEGT